MSTKFEEFLKSRQSPSVEEPVDWGKQRDEWIQYLNDFYALVESSLKPYIDQRKISIAYDVKKMKEEDIGAYEVKTARIKIGESTAKLDPIGTMLIGAKGRVDLVGPGGTARFLLVDADSHGPKITVRSWVEGQTPPPEPPVKKVVNWAWKMTTPPPQVTYLPLTKESLQDTLMEIMSG